VATGVEKGVRVLMTMKGIGPFHLNPGRLFLLLVVFLVVRLLADLCEQELNTEQHNEHWKCHTSQVIVAPSGHRTMTDMDCVELTTRLIE
jgi:hypothetical protein